jgi:hypothetical protein
MADMAGNTSKAADCIKPPHTSSGRLIGRATLKALYGYEAEASRVGTGVIGIAAPADMGTGEARATTRHSPWGIRTPNELCHSTMVK